MQAVVSVFKDFVNKVEDKPLEKILNDIKLGAYKTEISDIRNLLSNDNKQEADQLKKQLIAFTVSGTFNNGRSIDKINAYSKYVILDIDKLEDSHLQLIKNTTRLASYTYASFISPSGKGLKVIVKVNASKECHKEAYKQVVDYYEQALNIDIDTSGSDICRLCFVSYDEDCFINANADTFEVIIKPKEIAPPIKQNNQINNDIEAYISEIEKTATDITGNYETWRNLGFALSEEYGERGREYYHRISRFYIKYNYQECDKQFTNCLKAKGTGVNISTFYYMAHQNNIKPFKETIEEELLIQKEETNLEDYSDSPTFSTSLIPQLPQFLQHVVKYTKTDQEKDIMILGAITAISACLPKIYGIYDGDKVYSNLYLFITAAAASGKGKLKFCKRLVYKIHKTMREEAKLMEAEYDAELAQYNKNKAKDENLKKPPKPPIRMLFIPANNSSTGMFQLLHDSKGRGLIFETEADTLAKNFKTDYGDYSDGFRNAFHHETIKYFRRTDREYVEIEEPCLSCALTGTPKQVLALMPNAENGLFSRFMFYQMPTSTNWKNVFAIDTKKGLNEYFDNLGNEFYELYRQLITNTEIQFSYTEEQQEVFNQFFSKINLYYLNVNPLEYNSSIKRMGIIAFRISMILTVLRILETGDVSNPLYCSDEDFQTTLTMVKALIKHSSKVYSSLPEDKTAINYKNKKEQFIESLTLRFTTQDYISFASKLNITQKTAERYITSLCKSKFLARESQGNYYIPSKEVSEENEESKGNE
ncbi:DUF3987 domain-containing protein [Tenacibaculum sp. HL-MS23]|uniref:DUF3987 domain-containing protein n=1 Tax=Tenacibaculum sp. HL-MS23 TaxID=3077734 RepID=UPI0028FC30A2|nr:DUF3987 domain-containing protein [Tenacibaculum sp. HL-MS23]WNW01864.1 DUF3987 domain-containing protein [Tenacibaculum sp. HL-MS23]